MPTWVAGTLLGWAVLGACATATYLLVRRVLGERPDHEDTTLDEKQ